MNEAFWRVYKGLLTLDTTGRVFFTQRGKDTYTPLLRSIGMSIKEIRTLEQFQLAMQKIASFEQEMKNDELRRQLVDPAVPEKEKVYIRRILGVSGDSEPGVVIPFRRSLAPSRSK